MSRTCSGILKPPATELFSSGYRQHLFAAIEKKSGERGALEIDHQIVKSPHSGNDNGNWGMELEGT